MKRFNTEGACNPSKHYMVNIDDRIEYIKTLVAAGKYFTINRARQYGKTTTLNRLRRVLSEQYNILNFDFQLISSADFRTEESFVKSFSRMLMRKRKSAGIPEDVIETLQGFISSEEKDVTLSMLFDTIQTYCEKSDRSVILIIDEVDSAANNQVFLDFLSQLRGLYIAREDSPDEIHTFQSVILAGVTDVKHLRGRLRDDEQHKVNSPWNIAVEFTFDMSLSEEGIKGMLLEYESDHNTGMDTVVIAKLIRGYTEGYPYLVSRICQHIDQDLVPDVFSDLREAWTPYGVDEAVKILLSEKNTLFESLMGKLINYPDLKEALRNVLLKGEVLENLPDDEEQEQLRMYGFVRNHENNVVVSNKIFEMRLYRHFLGESAQANSIRQEAASIKNIFVEDGWLNIPLIMEHFIKSQEQIHGRATEKFLEQEGRERFLTYLSPIINGTGTYSIEPQTRDRRRMDVEIHYLGKRYIIELKIWHGERYNQRGEQQIIDYLNYFGLTTGYMLSFNFNKNKETGVKRLQIGEKVLFEGTV